MRAVKFNDRDKIPRTTSLMRTYKCVSFYAMSESDFNNVNNESNLLSNAEYVELFGCHFNGLLEFKAVLDMCKNLKEFKIKSTKFNVLDDIESDTTIHQQNRNTVRPIKCTIECTNWKVLDCFGRISQLGVGGQNREQSENYLKDVGFLLANYASVITHFDVTYPANELLYDYLIYTGSIGPRNETLKMLASNQILQLHSLTICDDDSGSNVALLQELFFKQHIYITTLRFIAPLTNNVLKRISQNLHSLQTLEGTIRNDITLNCLRTLSKLRSLVLTGHEHYSISHINVNLDIGELLSLTDVKLIGRMPMSLDTFNNASRKVMSSMKNISIINVIIPQAALFQIIKFMPNLQYLRLVHRKVDLFFFMLCFKTSLLIDIFRYLSTMLSY
jgi:hypothetical protein